MFVGKSVCIYVLYDSHIKYYSHINFPSILQIPSICPFYYITQSKPLYKCKIPYWLSLWRKFFTQYNCKSKPGSLSSNSTPHIQSAGQTVSAFLSRVYCRKQTHMGSNMSHESLNNDYIIKCDILWQWCVTDFSFYPRFDEYLWTNHQR